MRGRGLICAAVILINACTPIRHDEAIEKPEFVGGFSVYSPFFGEFIHPVPILVSAEVSPDSIPFSSVKPCQQALRDEAGRDRIEMEESYSEYAKASFEKSGIQIDEKAQVKVEFSIEYVDVPIVLAGSVARYCLLRIESVLASEGEQRVFWKPETRFTDDIPLYNGTYRYMVKPENLHSTVLAIINEHVKHLAPVLKGGQAPPLDVRPWATP